MFDPSIPPLHPDIALPSLPPIASWKKGSNVIDLVPDATLPIVSLSIIIRYSDLARDTHPATEHTSGERHSHPAVDLCAFTMKMLTRGTSTFSFEELSNQLDALGASLSGHATHDSVQIHLSVLEKNLEKALPLLYSVWHEPTFDDGEVERLKTQWHSQIIQNSFDPDYCASAAFRVTMFQGHRYSQSSLSTLERLPTITGEQCRDTWSNIRSRFTCHIVGAGCLTKEKLEAIVANFSIEANTTTVESTSPFPSRSGTSIVVTPVEAGSQATLRLGFQIFNPKHRWSVSQGLLMYIFGGGSSGKLFSRLREDLGLTYGIYAESVHRRDGSWVVVSGSLKADAVAQSINEILSIIESMRGELLPLELIQDSKRAMTGRVLRSLESPQQVAGIVQNLRQHSKEPDDFRLQYEQLQQLTAEDLLEVQAELFAPTGIVIAFSGKVDDLERDLAGFGSISIVT